MNSIKEIKNRINSIQSTKQITKSMQLIATSKLQTLGDALNKSRNFLEDLSSKMNDIVLYYNKNTHERYIEKREVKASCVVVISSDKGLCGSYNANIIKKAMAVIKDIKNPKIITIGIKAREVFDRSGIPLRFAFMGVSEYLFYEDAKEIASTALSLFKSGEVDEIIVVYTKFINTLSQKTEAKKILPLHEMFKESTAQSKFMTFEPADDIVTENAAAKFLSSYIYYALCQSAASEQASRFISMDAAVKNADELTEKLSGIYNRARQAAITQELSEVVSGADAVSKNAERN